MKHIDSCVVFSAVLLSLIKYKVVAEYEFVSPVATSTTRVEC